MTFNQKKVQAFSLLSNGMKITEVARELGINEKTVRRWLKDTSFKKDLADTNNEIIATVKADICAEAKVKRQELTTRIEEYRQECFDLSNGLIELGTTGLRLALKAMSKLDASEISNISQLEKLVRVINSTSDLGINLKAELLAIQPLLDALKQVTVNDEAQSI